MQYPTIQPPSLGDPLERAKRIRQAEAEQSINAALPEQMAQGQENQPMPVRPTTPPPSVEQAASVRDPRLNEADRLEQQAAPPAGPHGFKENLVAGLQAAGNAFANPHNYQQIDLQKKEMERQREQDLIGRAKELRLESQSQQKIGIDERRYSDEVNWRNQTAANTEKHYQDEAAHQKDQERIAAINAAKPKVGSIPKGAQSYIEDSNGVHFGQAVPDPGSTDEQINTLKDQIRLKKAKGLDTVEEEAQLKSHIETKLTTTEASGANAMNRLAASNEAALNRLNVSNDNIIKRQTDAAGRKEVIKKYEDLSGAQSLVKSMNDAVTRIESGKSSAIGADDMVILSNHIAMTMGQVKGARTGRDIIAAHKDAISLDQRLSRIVNTVVNGGQLTSDQRHEFLHAASDRLSTYQGQYAKAKTDFNYTPEGELTQQETAPVATHRFNPATNKIEAIQ